MEEEVEFVLEDITNELKDIIDKFYVISRKLWDYDQTSFYPVFLFEVFSEKEKKELEKLVRKAEDAVWEAEDAVWELYKAFEKKIAELEKKLEDLDEG